MMFSSVQGVSADVEELSVVDEISIEEELSVEIEIDGDLIMPLENLLMPLNLPSSHDVSLSNTFPPIRDQGSNTRTCAGWAFGYYQMTNNLANRRGLNARNNTRYQIHPIWAYNLINGGGHRDTYNTDALNALASFGGLSWFDFEQLGFSSTTYSTWFPGVAWERALGNSAERIERLWLTYNNDNNIDHNALNNLRRLLADGYVVTFHTQYSGRHLPNWNTMTSRARPDGVPSPVGQTVATWARSANGGHFMTIVGFDDNIWVDVNGNGVIDPGELGALKIANSEGTGWGNGGFMWLSYDALRRTTIIPNAGWQSNRIPAITAGQLEWLVPKPEYTPLLMAEVVLNTGRRAFVDVEIGVSPTTTTTPAMTLGATHLHTYGSANAFRVAFNSPSLHTDSNMRGTGINWTGQTATTDGTFMFDLTPIIERYRHQFTPNTPLRFYVRIRGNNANFPVEIRSFRLIDRNNNFVGANAVSAPFPRTAAANSHTIMAWADYTLPQRIVGQHNSINLQFSSPIQTATITPSTVRVENGRGEVVNVNLNHNVNNRRNLNISPSGGWERFTFYTLTITTQVRSDGGNTLAEEQIIKFFVP